LHERTHSGSSAGIEFTERRRFKRIPVIRPVKYLSKEFGETSSLVLELSYGGAYIESPVVAVGSEIEMEFNLMDGHTVRATEAISEEDKAQIESFVKGFRIQTTLPVTDDLK
jgi:hypothetical protein